MGTNPRNLDSLGGKVLRVHRNTGAAMPDNPYAGATSARRFVWTYGHRNVQGLAQRPDGSLWSVEHGSYRDDEVNLLVKGGDYGWNPVPGYNEEVPMTDQSLPGVQQDAKWSSGEPTLATSGAAWVSGAQWGDLDGTLAVAALKAVEVLFLRFDARGGLQSVTRPPALQRFGRLRSITVRPQRRPADHDRQRRRPGPARLAPLIRHGGLRRARDAEEGPHASSRHRSRRPGPGAADPMLRVLRERHPEVDIVVLPQHAPAPVAPVLDAGERDELAAAAEPSLDDLLDRIAA